MSVSQQLWVREGGSGEPVLLLLHGIGANADVWELLLEHVSRDWKGRWIAPDLLGHGRSPRCSVYSTGVHAAAVATLLAKHDPVYILGHSMGAAVAFALASGWFGLNVRHVLAIGVKVDWSAEEIGRASAVANTAVRWFDTEEAAVARYLRVSGLENLVGPTSAIARGGVVIENDRYRLAADPGVYGMAGRGHGSELIALSKASIDYAAGSTDTLISPQQLRALSSDAMLFEGAGHNVHVAKPAEVWAWAKHCLNRKIAQAAERYVET